MGARRLTVIFAIVFASSGARGAAIGGFRPGQIGAAQPFGGASPRILPMRAFPVAGAELDRETINEIITACSALINSEGGNDEARSIVHLQRGSMYRRLGKFDLALADFTMSIHYDPKSADAYTGRGNAHRGLHQIRGVHRRP